MVTTITKKLIQALLENTSQGDVRSNITKLFDSSRRENRELASQIIMGMGLIDEQQRQSIVTNMQNINIVHRDGKVDT